MPIGFGERVRKLREDHGFTLRQLGDKIGTSKSYVWQIENKEHPNPSANVVLDIARIFGVSPYYLIHDDLPEQSKNIEDVILINKLESLTNTDKLMVAEMVDALYKRAG
jgi:transcriptional regulator with XRE-family HTH domain